jgi:hypothetical protein
MPLSQQAIEDLKAIYRKHYGRDLPDEEAWEMGHRLLRIFTVLTRMPKKSSKHEGSNPVPFD